MLQLSASTAYTFCVGCPVDVSGNTMKNNSHTPITTDFAIDQSTSLNANDTLSVDNSGNVYLTLSGMGGYDFTAAGPHQIVCTNATYSMVPKELMIGALAASGNWNTTTPPTTSAIASAIWQDLTSRSDFTTLGSIGKLLAAIVNQTGDAYAVVTNATYGLNALYNILETLTTAAGNLNNLSALGNIFGPTQIMVPGTGTSAFPYVLALKDSEGHGLDPNSGATVTITVANQTGTSLGTISATFTNGSGAFSTPTYTGKLSNFSRSSAGWYTFLYTASAVDATGQGGSMTAVVSSIDTNNETRTVALPGGVDFVNFNTLSSLASMLSILQEFQFDGSNNVKAAPQTPVTLAASQPNYAPLTDLNVNGNAPGEESGLAIQGLAGSVLTDAQAAIAASALLPIIVTGCLTPAANGIYYPFTSLNLEAVAGNAGFWVNAAGTYAIWIDLTNNLWVITTFANVGTPGSGLWTAPSQTQGLTIGQPYGLVLAPAGTSTGSATLAIYTDAPAAAAAVAYLASGTVGSLPAYNTTPSSSNDSNFPTGFTIKKNSNNALYVFTRGADNIPELIAGNFATAGDAQQIYATLNGNGTFGNWSQAGAFGPSWSISGAPWLSASYTGQPFTLVSVTPYTFTPAGGYTGMIPASGTMVLNGQELPFTWSGTSFTLSPSPAPTFLLTTGLSWQVPVAGTQLQTGGSGGSLVWNGNSPGSPGGLAIQQASGTVQSEAQAAINSSGLATSTNVSNSTSSIISAISALVIPTASAIASAVWNVLTSTLTTAGTIGRWILGTTQPVGPGGVAVTIAITDTSNNPIAGVGGWITSDSAGATTIAGTLQSNSLGSVGFMLNAGLNYLWRMSLTYDFPNPVPITVTGPSMSITLADGTPITGPVSGYAMRSDLENIFGVPNIIKWAILSQNDPASPAGLAEVTARINWAISVATADFNNAMRQGRYTLPIVGTDASVWATTVVATLAGLLLYQHLKPTQRDQDGRPIPDRYDGIFTWAEQQMNFVRSSKLRLDASVFGKGTNAPEATHERSRGAYGPGQGGYGTGPFPPPGPFVG